MTKTTNRVVCLDMDNTIFFTKRHFPDDCMDLHPVYFDRQGAPCSYMHDDAYRLMCEILEDYPNNIIFNTAWMGDGPRDIRFKGSCGDKLPIRYMAVGLCSELYILGQRDSVYQQKVPTDWLNAADLERAQRIPEFYKLKPTGILFRVASSQIASPELSSFLDDLDSGSDYIFYREGNWGTLGSLSWPKWIGNKYVLDNYMSQNIKDPEVLVVGDSISDIVGVPKNVHVMATECSGLAGYTWNKFIAAGLDTDNCPHDFYIPHGTSGSSGTFQLLKKVKAYLDGEDWATLQCDHC